MAKKVRKIFLSALSVLTLGCLTVGVMGTSTKTAAAESVTDNNFWVTGGTYTRTDRESTSDDGIKFNIVPTTDGGDVTLTLKGAHRRYTGAMNTGAGSWWGGRMLMYGEENIEGRIITYRSPTDAQREISFISTAESTYVSFTSDIEFKEGVPYIVGSTTPLNSAYTASDVTPLTSIDYDFKPTNIPGSVGLKQGTTDCTLSGAFKVNGADAANILDETTLANWDDVVPTEYAYRYTSEWVTALCKDLGLNDTILEITYVGVPASGTVSTIRALNGVSYYNEGPLSFVAPRAMLVQKDNTLVAMNEDVNMNELFEVWSPVVGKGKPTLDAGAQHTYSDYDSAWTTTALNSGKGSAWIPNTTTAKTNDGWNSFNPANAYNKTDNTAYYVVKDSRTEINVDTTQTGTFYLYAQWKLINKTEELLEQKTDTLCLNHAYTMNEVFGIKSNAAEKAVNVTYYLGADSATGDKVGPIAINDSDAKFTVTEGTSYSIYLSATNNATATKSAAEAKAFTFTVAATHQAQTIAAVAPTCENSGLTEGSVCSVCGEVITAQTTVAAKGHAYGTPSYVWAENNSTCTATTICANDEEHVLTETVNVASSVTQNKTCENDELSTLTATFTDSVFTTQTKENVKTADKGHTYGAVTYTWSADNSTCTATRTCANDGTHVETETVNAVKTVTQTATTSKVELSKFEATFANTAFAKQTKENVQTGDMLPATSAPESSTPDNSTTDNDSSESGGGCFGSIGSLGGVSLILAMAAVLVAIKRRKEN